MSRICVVHRDLMTKGGGEAVCMHLLEGLQRKFDVVLYTLVEPDFQVLNDYFNTNVEPESVSIQIPWYGRIVRHVEGTGELFKSALLARSLDCREFDLVVNTTLDELPFSAPSIQYFNVPKFDRRFVEADLDLGLAGQLVEPSYRTTCRLMAGFSPSRLSSDHLVSMSEWTANLFERTYGYDTDVIYPPVSTDEYESRAWEDRDDGFISIGRISPNKNLIQNIDIVNRLHDRGHNVHYHIVGTPDDEDYVDVVQDRAAEHDYVHFEGEVTYDRLVELVEAHKFGLHGRTREHFGIAVAELVAGGTIPFVPDDGGQCEIVGNLEPLLYGSVDEAVQKVVRVLEDESLQTEMRRSLPDIEATFGADRFKQEMVEVVSEAVS